MAINEEPDLLHQANCKHRDDLDEMTDEDMSVVG